MANVNTIFNNLNLTHILLSYTNLRNITTHIINKQLPIQGLYCCSDSNPTTCVASILVVAATCLNCCSSGSNPAHDLHVCPSHASALYQLPQQSNVG